MCGPTERVFFDFVLKLPVPQPCDVNLKPDLGRGVCVSLPCGAEGQRACTVFERLPSCDVNLVEVAGSCVRPPCGRLNERICAVSVRNTSGIWLGMCDANLVPGPGEVCIRPGLAMAGAQQAAAPAGSAGTVHSAAPASSAVPPPPPGALPPPPPGALRPPPAVAPPAVAPSLAAVWMFNGNGHAGEASVQQAPDGVLIGRIYGDPLTGYFAPGERVAVWLRGAPAQPIQAFVGAVAADGSSFGGRMYGLNGTTSGATVQRNLFAFSALRAASAPPGHPGLPNAAAGPSSVSGTLVLNANNQPGQLVLVQTGDGTLSGSVYGDRVSGHYAAGTGSIAFLRFAGTQPMQLYVGTVTAQGISGEFYALTPSAGASAQRMRYSWTAQAPQAAAAPGSLAASPASVGGLEPDTDRNGSDLWGFVMAQADPLQCRAVCSAVNDCQAWTYMKPGVRGPSALCFLKNGVPQARPNACCTSGVKSAQPMNLR
jgi:hypothetical protein